MEEGSYGYDLPARLKLLLKKSTEAVYRSVSRGLFERHKLLLPLLLCSGVLRSTGEVMASTKTCASKGVKAYLLP